MESHEDEKNKTIPLNWALLAGLGDGFDKVKQKKCKLFAEKYLQKWTYVIFKRTSNLGFIISRGYEFKTRLIGHRPLEIASLKRENLFTSRKNHQGLPDFRQISPLAKIVSRQILISQILLKVLWRLCARCETWQILEPAEKY